jgi:hypothetical protein
VVKVALLSWRTLELTTDGTTGTHGTYVRCIGPIGHIRANTQSGCHPEAFTKPLHSPPPSSSTSSKA